MKCNSVNQCSHCKPQYRTKAKTNVQKVIEKVKYRSKR